MCFSSQTQRTPVQTISLPGTPSEEGGGLWVGGGKERGRRCKGGFLAKAPLPLRSVSFVSFGVNPSWVFKVAHKVSIILLQAY